MSDMLNPAGGYGNLFGYNVANIRADGFEVKNMSNEILRYMRPSLVFSLAMNQSRNSFGVGRGGTFKVPIFKEFGAITSVTPLTSGTSIGIGTQKTDSVEFAMQEYGTGVGYEKLGDWMTDLAVRTEIQKSLAFHISKMTNWLDYDILSNTQFSIEVPATGSYTNLMATNRQVQGTGFGELGVGGVALAYDSFKASGVAPTTSRGQYVWFATPETLRNLKSGSVFINQMLYSKLAGNDFNVLGEFQGFVFVETNELLNKGTSIVVGGNAAGYGFGMPPRTWFYPDYGNDAERLQVWKTLFYRGQGAIFRDKGTSCIMVRSKSAAFNYGGLG